MQPIQFSLLLAKNRAKKGNLIFTTQPKIIINFCHKLLLFILFNNDINLQMPGIQNVGKNEAGHFYYKFSISPLIIHDDFIVVLQNLFYVKNANYY